MTTERKILKAAAEGLVLAACLALILFLGCLADSLNLTHSTIMAAIR